MEKVKRVKESITVGPSFKPFDEFGLDVDWKKFDKDILAVKKHFRINKDGEEVEITPKSYALSEMRKKLDKMKIVFSDTPRLIPYRIKKSKALDKLEGPQYLPEPNAPKIKGKKHDRADDCDYHADWEMNAAARLKLWEEKPWNRQVREFGDKKNKRKTSDVYTTTKTVDPFNIDDQQSWSARYMAGLVKKLYPDGKYHKRGLHYKLLHEHFCVPGALGKGGTKGLLRYTENRDIDNTVNDALYAGYLDYKDHIDKRITESLRGPYDVNFSNPTDTVKAELDFDLVIDRDFENKVQANYPAIIIFSEKSETDYPIDEVAKQYYIKYYSGSGHISVTGAREMYDYIKEHSNLGIIFTLTDFDKTGWEIPTALARKIQFFFMDDYGAKMSDINIPTILVYSLGINSEQIELLEGKGISPVLKDGKEVYEINALMYYIEHFSGKSFSAWIKNEIELLIGPGMLLPREDYLNHLNDERTRLFDETRGRLMTEIKNYIPTFPQRKVPNAFIELAKRDSLKDYIKGLKQYVTDLPQYKVLQKAVENIDFKPNDLVSKSPVTKLKRKETTDEWNVGNYLVFLDSKKKKIFDSAHRKEREYENTKDKTGLIKPKPPSDIDEPYAVNTTELNSYRNVGKERYKSEKNE